MMKCLENLSLVADENLEQLKKDIERLINDYIDLEKACLKAYDSVVDKLDKNDIIRITHSFNPDWYLVPPKPIYTDSDFVELVAELAEYGGEECGCDILNMIGPMNNLGVFDKKKNNYWYYKDGANWEAWLLDEEYFKKEIREGIECHMEDEDFLVILKALRVIQKKYNVKV